MDEKLILKGAEEAAMLALQVTGEPTRPAQIDILKLAQEVGLYPPSWEPFKNEEWGERWERALADFVARVQKAERERCAKLAEAFLVYTPDHGRTGEGMPHSRGNPLIAAAIRALSSI